MSWAAGCWEAEKQSRIIRLNLMSHSRVFCILWFERENQNCWPFLNHTESGSLIRNEAYFIEFSAGSKEKTDFLFFWPCHNKIPGTFCKKCEMLSYRASDQFYIQFHWDHTCLLPEGSLNMLLDCERKTEYLEKTHTNTKGISPHRTTPGPNQGFQTRIFLLGDNIAHHCHCVAQFNYH